MQIQYTQYLNMLNQWLILKQEGKSIASYLSRQGYHSVAVYGMSVYGRHVIRDLRKTDIAVVYGIDRKKMPPFEEIKIIQPVGSLPPADAIICTVLQEFSGIKNSLKLITDIPVISLEDVVFESYG